MSLGLALLLLAVANPLSSQPTGQTRPIEIGTAHRLASKALAETRTVNVILPASYDRAPTKRYPVVYLIDGGVEQDLLHVSGVVHLGALWARSTEAIVVGIETKDRRRELVGPTKDPELVKKYPTVGSSAAFRKFIRAEVKPLVDSKYRTNGRNVVLGESLAGLFIVETYLREPDLFDGYGAISPSLWWDKEALSKTAAERIGERHSGRALYLAIADEGAEMRSSVDRVVSALHAKAAALCFTPRDDLTHSTIYQQLTPQALQFLLPPAEAPPPEFGFTVDCAPKP